MYLRLFIIFCLGSFRIVNGRNGDCNLNSADGCFFGAAENSHMIFKFSDDQNYRPLNVSVFFRTDQTNATIFSVAGENEHGGYGLYIVHSRLIFSLFCDEYNQFPNIIYSINVSDNQWHSVFIYSDEKEIRFYGDNHVHRVNSNGCKKQKIKSPYSFGYVESSLFNKVKLQLPEELNAPFIGCLKNVNMANGNQTIIENANIVKSVGVVPCNDNIESGASFPGGGNYVIARKNVQIEVAGYINASMKIKTRNNNGILMVVHSKNQQIILRIVNRIIEYNVNSGNESLYSIKFNSIDVADNQWHSINIHKRKRVISLIMDNLSRSQIIHTDDRSMETGNLYIGGVPLSVHNLHGVDNITAFAGCIKDMEYNQVEINISKGEIFGGVNPFSCSSI